MNTQSMQAPLVSVIVPTYNSAATLDNCLRSIKAQTYQSIELIIVDNNSTDTTREIARQYTPRVYIHGPERCAQRNFGVTRSIGEYLVIIDSDMELSPGVIASCVAKCADSPHVKAVIIPEESFGKGFWAQCKRLERSFYIGVDWIEAARFFDRQVYVHAGGYDETLTSGEDWDLSQRVGRLTGISRISDVIRHNEGHLRLFKTLRKKSYYAKQFTNYTAKRQPTHGSNPYLIVLRRFGLFFSKPYKLLRNPILGGGMLFMKVCEFGSGAFGYLGAKEEDG